MEESFFRNKKHVNKEAIKSLLNNKISNLIFCLNFIRLLLRNPVPVKSPFSIWLAAQKKKKKKKKLEPLY